MPTNDTVEERIIANVITTLALIVAGDDYYTTIKTVQEMEGSALENIPKPCAIVYYDENDESYGDQDRVQNFLHLKIGLGTHLGPTWRKDMRRFVADVKRALRVDTGRGTFNESQNAFDTYIDKTVIASATDGFPCGVGQIDITIQYRNLFSDASVAI